MRFIYTIPEVAAEEEEGEKTVGFIERDFEIANVNFMREKKMIDKTFRKGSDTYLITLNRRLHR